ncbi:hypothetical protein [Planktothrix phage Pra-JY27]|nr:hypothetical protein [Planktothrix phage Pag-Yong1]WEV89196.1 hypothetical protein [Synechococcus phage MinM2]
MKKPIKMTEPKLDPRNHKPTFPSMGSYIDASKEPRRIVRGTKAQRQARTFGKNG